MSIAGVHQEVAAVLLLVRRGGGGVVEECGVVVCGRLSLRVVHYDAVLRWWAYPSLLYLCFRWRWALWEPPRGGDVW